MEIIALIVLASLVWPGLLLGAAVMAVIAWLAQGRARALAFAAAVVLGFGALLGGVGRQADDRFARLRGELQAETVIEGITLPAGTQVTWKDLSHTRLDWANTPQPTTILGVSAQGVGREQGDQPRLDDPELDAKRERERDDWLVNLDRAQEIDGWPCASGQGERVRFDSKGALRSCALSRQVEWKGWTLPKDSRIRLLDPGRRLDLYLSRAEAVFAREIGQRLPAFVLLNEDGSLDSVEFNHDASFVVHGTRLQGTVWWCYDAATLGEGRARPPVTVESITFVGMNVGYERVVVRVSDGVVTRKPVTQRVAVRVSDGVVARKPVTKKSGPTCSQ